MSKFHIAFIVILCIFGTSMLGGCASTDFAANASSDSYDSVPYVDAPAPPPGTPPGKSYFARRSDGTMVEVKPQGSTSSPAVQPSQVVRPAPPIVVYSAPMFCPSYRTFSLFGTYTPGCPGYGGYPYYPPYGYGYGGGALFNFRLGGGEHHGGFGRHR